jgi:organic radical activating enzyme
MITQEAIEDNVPVAREKGYRVKAIWKTLQGEGLFAGRPAVFVRLVGCNLWSGYARTRERDAVRTGADCPLWCDTEFTKEGSRLYGASELAAAVRAEGDDIRFCVITGGEPLLQLDAAVVEALHGQGFFIAIETNGTVSLAESCAHPDTGQLVPPDWIVCSPKLPEDKLMLEYFDELKLVVPGYLPEQYRAFSGRQRVHTVQGSTLPLLWLQPEDGPRKGEATKLAIQMALSQPAWRVSVQTHKILDVE